ncbi:solute carrier family 22 member 13-like [Simochromis diagramma]|uniref:solute carrier family 22 member 13-like n=1 Tax=Simochromis diagramma TaxID=43689 RepID=UPI001A7E6158|nr:solute carrier family 22 member 13-like [Simochromis diagramma]
MADFGEILRSIGEFGLFQKITLFALSFPNVILPFHFASVLFIQSDPDRRCNTDWILNAAPNLTTEEQLNLTMPREDDGTFSRCRMFVPVDWDIGAIREYGLNDTTRCQSGWVYGNMLYEATIVTDFMAGVCYGGYRLNGVILATEWIGVSNRSWGACVTQLCGAVGQCLLAGMIYFVRNWRLAQLITAAPLALVAIYIWCALTLSITPSLVTGTFEFIKCHWPVLDRFIPESARWLLGTGRTTEAKQLIKKAAAINKRTVPNYLLDQVPFTTFTCLCIETIIVKDPEKKGGIKTLIQSAVLRKYFFTITLAWFSLNVAYFCLSFSVGKLGLNIFVTQAVFGLSEIPAHILSIWLLEAVGRKPSLMATLLIGGLLCLLMLAVPQGYAVAITALATCGRFLTNWAGSVCNVYVQELFPTSFRQTASGLGSIVYRTGGLISPPVNMLAIYHWSIPIIVYSSLTLISGALAFLLPETRRKELPDSTDEAEANGTKTMERNQSGSNLPPQSKSTKL